MRIKSGKYIKSVASNDYNYTFDKQTGYFARWGKTREDDPVMAPGFEILDWELSTICDNNCRFCIPRGFKVFTYDGKKDISDIKINDIVLSYNEKTHVTEYQSVTNVYSRYYEGDIICIETEDGGYLEITPNHQIYIKNKGWVEAKDISDSDEVISI